MSVAVFAIVASGVATTTIMTSRIAHENIHQNTAYMVAQAYAEQIKSINFDQIDRALKDPVKYDIPTQSLSYGAGLGIEDLKKDDPLIFGVPLEKKVVVDLEDGADGDVDERVMRMWIQPEGRNLVEDTACWDSIEVVLNFEWESFTGKELKRRSGQVRLVKTNVSEY